MASWSIHVLPLLPLLLLLTSAASKAQEAVPFSGCSNSFPPRTCPSVSTVQGFDLSAYVGKWYEIGVTSRFKLSTEPGLACVFANYTLAKAPTPTEGGNVTVFNSGIQVLGSIAQAGIRQLDVGVAGACAASRLLCGLLAPAAPLQLLLDKVKELSAQLTGEDGTTLTSAVEDITVKLHSVRAATNSVIAKLKQITLKAGDLSQAVGTKSSQLSQFQGLGKAAYRDILAISIRVGDIHAARARFIPVAQSLLAAAPANASRESSFLLLQAYIGIGLEETAILEKADEAKSYVRSLLLATRDLIKMDNSSPLTPFSIAGYLDQSASDPAKLQVHFPIPGVRPDPVGAPYWVVAITGEASQGYEAVVVYSCSEIPGRGLDTGIFILSRTPTLSTQVVDSLLAKAADLGFIPACDNSFILTVQDHAICNN